MGRILQFLLSFVCAHKWHVITKLDHDTGRRWFFRKCVWCRERDLFWAADNLDREGEKRRSQQYADDYAAEFVQAAGDGE